MNVVWDLRTRSALLAVGLVWACAVDGGVASSSSRSNRSNPNNGTGASGGGSNPNYPSSDSGGSSAGSGSGDASGGSFGSGTNGGSDSGPKAEPGPLDVTPVSVTGPTTWKNGAKGAYTIIHDDTCDPKMKSHYELCDVELTRRGLRAGFGTISGMCAGGGQELRGYIGAKADGLQPQWAQVRKLVEHGHEIVNHSWSHVVDVEPDGFPAVDEARWQLEIDRGRELLASNLGLSPDYFIFPYDAFQAPHLEYLNSKGYLGARAGKRTDGINSADFENPQAIDFAVYDEREGGNTDMEGVILQAITEGGWGMREIHAVSDAGDGWMPVPVQKYLAHLDLAQQRTAAGELWMDGPGAVVRYRFARQYCAAPSVSGNRLTFSQDANCTKYATELTFEVQCSTNASELVAIQGGRALTTVRIAAGSFRVNADPTKGEVELSGR